MTGPQINPHYKRSPKAVRIDAVCPYCTGTIWFKKPSGATFCATCGAPYSPDPVAPPRP